jgi:hypothetical protein
MMMEGAARCEARACAAEILSFGRRSQVDMLVAISDTHASGRSLVAKQRIRCVQNITGLNFCF